MNPPWLVLGAGVVLILPARAQSALYTFHGDAAGDSAGGSVSRAGDVDGDGYADLLVGASGDDDNGTGCGSATVYSGQSGGLLWRVFGDLSGDQLGGSVSTAGDVDNDGQADFIVGALGSDVAFADAGMARVFSGANGQVLHTFSGDSSGDFFGYSVSDAGDVDNDGFADLIVGAYLDSSNGNVSGSAYLYSGASGAQLRKFTGDSAGDQFGWSLSAAGDVDGDGFPDQIVGAYLDAHKGTGSGSATVFSGASGAVLYVFDGNSSNDYFGHAVSAAGDIDQDGFADLIVGAWGDDDNGSNSGSARVLSGATGTVLFQMLGDSSNDFFGYSVSDAGDVDGGGVPDLIVGAYGDDDNGTNSGSARVFSGATGQALFTLRGDNANDNFGRSVSGADNVDSVGFGEVLVGAQGDDDKGSNSGSARVISSQKGLVLFSYTGGPGDRLGSALCAAGDLDADGFADVLVGAPLDDAPLADAGSATVLSGRNASLLAVFSGASAGEQLGSALAGLGDLDGDGHADVAVTSPREDAAGIDSGGLRWYSGANGALLGFQAGLAPGEFFGSSLAGLGDLDGDGVGDWICGAPLASGAAGAARLYSGATQLLLRSFAGLQAGDQWGAAVAGLGDLDLDGVPDYAIGAPFADSAGPDSGRARIFSGASGAQLFDQLGEAAGEHFGQALCGLGDLNLDGSADFALAAPLADSNGPDAGRVRAFSGATGLALFNFLGSAPGALLGSALANPGDVDQDGRTDLLLGAPGESGGGSGAGAMRLVSGLNGALLFLLGGDAAGDQLGASVAGVGDTNQDGYPDLAAGAPFSDAGGSDSGLMRVYSGVPVALSVDKETLSLQAGGVQNLTLSAGASHASDLYLLLGSASGTQPGTPVDALFLPLVSDAWLLYTLLYPNTPPLSGSLGFLDFEGKGSVHFTLPPNSDPNLAGIELNHAYLVVDLFGGTGVTFTSNPVPLMLLP